MFYPCLTYNFDEGLSDNHYNCPVVAYYPEVISANVSELEGLNFINDYLGVHRKKDFPEKMHGVLAKYFDGISLKEVKTASEKGIC
ncbi:MAG: acyl-CoA dehydratase activase-related protein [Acutalibacteraceae bacterium]